MVPFNRWTRGLGWILLRAVAVLLIIGNVIELRRRADAGRPQNKNHCCGRYNDLPDAGLSIFSSQATEVEQLTRPWRNLLTVAEVAIS